MTGVALTEDLPLIKFIAAFVFVIATMLALAWGVKRSGLVGPMMKMGQKRRLKVIEMLPVDHRRKLILVRRDGREHLLLLGPDHALVVEQQIEAPADVLESVQEEPARVTA